MVQQEPLRSPPLLLTALNLATGPHQPPMGGQGDALPHRGTDSWRPLPEGHPPQSSKESFQPLQSSFASRPPPQLQQQQRQQQHHSWPQQQQRAPSPSSLNNDLASSPLRVDLEPRMERKAPSPPALLSRLDLAERKRRQARARVPPPADSASDSESESSDCSDAAASSARKRPVVWSGPPLRLDVNPKVRLAKHHVPLKFGNS